MINKSNNTPIMYNGFCPHTIQNISTRLKTAKTAMKNNYLKNSFYENKNE